jgi:hypothetical protein
MKNLFEGEWPDLASLPEPQKTTFDAVKAEGGKRKGMAQAVAAREPILQVARRLAVEIGRIRGKVTADDVQMELIRQGYHPSDLGPAAGSIFKTAEFEFTGEWIKSERVSNHSRYLRVWRVSSR